MQTQTQTFVFHLLLIPPNSATLLRLTCVSYQTIRTGSAIGDDSGCNDNNSSDSALHIFRLIKAKLNTDHLHREAALSRLVLATIVCVQQRRAQTTVFLPHFSASSTAFLKSNCSSYQPGGVLREKNIQVLLDII
jgi:hypothetical protein